MIRESEEDERRVVTVDTEAEAYVVLTMAALPHAPGLTQTQLREWWTKSAEHRMRLELTPELDQMLVDFCRTLIWQLPDGGPPLVSKPPARSSGSVQRRPDPRPPRR